jgi:hypothetical protein
MREANPGRPVNFGTMQAAKEDQKKQTLNLGHKS